MKVLIVCSGNSCGYGGDDVNKYLSERKSFIFELSECIRNRGIHIEFFLIRGKGILGYLRELKELRSVSKRFDLIHAFYGLSGLLAILQIRIPVIITFLGSDINYFKQNLLSSVASIFCKWKIFVSEGLYQNILVRPNKNYSILPFGVDFSTFRPIDRVKARQSIGLKDKGKYILFSSSFDRPVKNYELAEKAKWLLGNVEMIEMMKGLTRSEVNALFNACDVLLMTSFKEGSPQVIKEAMACNCPIVSTDVGDVKKVIGNTEGCYICSYDPEDVAEKIRMALNFGKRTNGRERIKELSLDSDIIAKKIIKIYEEVLKKANG